MNASSKRLTLTLLGMALACLGVSLLLVRQVTSPPSTKVDVGENRSESASLLRASRADDVRIATDASAPAVPAVLPESAADSPGRLAFLLASSGQPIVEETWTLRSSDGSAQRSRSDSGGCVSLLPGVWQVEPPAHFFVAGGGRVVVSPERTSVVWVAEECDVVLQIQSEFGEPLEGAVATWFVHEAKTDFYASMEQNSVVSDEDGRAVLRSVPVAWAGRALVTHPTHLPHQGTIEPACSGEPEVVTLNLDGASGRVVRIVDAQREPVAGVSAYTEMGSSNWPDARPFHLGTSDAKGLLNWPEWIDGASGIVFRGAAYPCRYRWKSTTELELVESIEVPVPATGELHIQNPLEDDVYRVTIIDETSSAALGLMRASTHHVAADATIEVTLPGGRPMSVAVVEERGARSWSGTLTAPSNGWRSDITLEERSEPLRIQSDGDRIAAYCFDIEAGNWLSVAADAGVDGALTLDLPSGTRRLSLRSSAGTESHLWRHCESTGGVVRIAFAPLHDVHLTLRDATDEPVRDAWVEIRGKSGSAAPTTVKSACWSWSPRYSGRAQPDFEGTVSFRMPEGEYALTIGHMAHRESTDFTSLNQTRPDLATVYVPPAGLTQTLVVPRPRQLTVTLRPRDGKLPARWRLWDLVQERGQVFYGRSADLWITDAAGAFEVEGVGGELQKSFDVSAGAEPVAVDVHF
ncbi:MAG: hypothetical protein WD226_07925 [Planctomycetota bacterium]